MRKLIVMLLVMGLGLASVACSQIKIKTNTCVVEVEAPLQPQHLRLTLPMPGSFYDVDFGWCLVPKLADPITITRIDVSAFTANIGVFEVVGQLRYADSFVTRSNPVTINSISTTSGALCDSTIDVSSVPAGKAVYFWLQEKPDYSVTQIAVDVTYEVTH
ncbi:MAG: hypothetical protein GX421_12495 [Caldisericales bacterium]|nr:hypothetical protein [Caldisericales bacterium]